MAGGVTIRQLNEEAFLCWETAEQRSVRFSYSSRFYGECVLKARVKADATGRLFLLDDSVEAAQIESRGGTGELVIKAATTLLQHSLNNGVRLPLNRSDTPPTLSGSGRSHWAFSALKRIVSGP